MTPTDIVLFALTLFLALAALLRWKHRRDKIADRLNQKLHGYMAVQDSPPTEGTPENGESRRSLIRVA